MRTSSPPMRISPASGVSTPERILISVDLPAPLSPRRASTSFSRSSSETSRRAVVAPNCLRRLETSSTGALPLERAGIGQPSCPRMVLKRSSSLRRSTSSSTATTTITPIAISCT